MSTQTTTPASSAAGSWTAPSRSRSPRRCSSSASRSASSAAPARVALWRAAEHLEEMSQYTGKLQTALAELRTAQSRSHLLFVQAATVGPGDA